ncbi:MAG: M1 family peptidase [Bacteroidetes bacterium]|nr:M1 family peptidase [Bacteroidota bacterium]
MKKNLLFVAILLISNLLFSQSIFPENTYRTEQNQYYWKNRKPHSDYWQQDVHYKINAALDEKTSIISANEELTYWNNSPDTIRFVYFHLYQNAFQPGSYTDDLHKKNKFPIKYGPYEKQGLGTVIEKITINGQQPKTELDNTILKVFLTEALAPNSSIAFSIEFKTYFDDKGNIRRRMKSFNSYGNKHFDGVHWYPRIAVYDQKKGWDTDQHLTREFYGDFGTFDVSLTLPSHYITEATGILLNEKEVLPDTLRQKLDLKNFTNKPLYTSPSTIIPADGKTKTWHYHADNVHDFAFTTDPTYRIGEEVWNGIRCIAVVQESHAARWQNAASYTAKVIEINSTDFGMYAYPKMVVADARDGMEYPMLTLDNGLDPDYRDLLAHEISHNWFFGMVGSNETYRAAMDEGFTQFLTAWTYIKIDGKERIRNKSKSNYVEKYIHPDYIMNSEVYNNYIIAAANGDESVLNTHSDGFNSALRHGGGYGQVYMKTATMLYNLQYVLGDDLFLKAMQHYFNQWKMCHPYMEDFRSSVINYTKVDLNWFFDQWLETSKTIDYSIKRVKKIKNTNNYAITFKRIGRMQMPLDFRVIGKDSSVKDYYIPNTWFEKKTTATTLPRWIGWDKLKSTYTATITAPDKIKNVIIDPSNRLADVNMLNNRCKLPISYELDAKVNTESNWQKYEIYARPDVWYNGYDGIKTGVHVNGSHMKTRHVFNANIWLNTGLAQNFLDTAAFINKYDDIGFTFNYNTSTDKFLKHSRIYADVKIVDGLNSYALQFNKASENKKNILFIIAKSMYRNSIHDLNYLLLPREWQLNKLNNTLALGNIHKYNYKNGIGEIVLMLKTSAFTNDYSYSHASLESVNKNDWGKLNFNSRFFVLAGWGTSWANESFLYASGANPEQLMENKYTRAMGAFDPKMAAYGASTNNFHAGGGLNLRGFSGYLLPEVASDGFVYLAYKGTNGAAVNIELEFQELFKPKRPIFKNTFKLETYLFADAGFINYNYNSKNLYIGNIRADAGIGAAFTIQRWGVLQNIKPLTIRADFPLFLNSIPAVENEYFDFRWIVGINRAF